MVKIFELEAKEQEQFERDYADWCQRYDVNYIVEREEDLKPKTKVLDNQKN